MPSKKRSEVNVRVINDNGPSSLVEWEDEKLGQVRGSIPTDVISDNAAEQESLEMAVPAGIPWEELTIPEINPVELSVQLRKRGIWTANDLKSNPLKAIAAIQDACGLSLKWLKSKAEAYERGERIT